MKPPPQSPPVGHTDAVELTYATGPAGFVKVTARLPAAGAGRFPDDLELPGGEPLWHWQADFKRFRLVSYRPVVSKETKR